MVQVMAKRAVTAVDVLTHGSEAMKFICGPHGITSNSECMRLGLYCLASSSVCAVPHMLNSRGLAQSRVAGTHPVWGTAPASSSWGEVAQ